MEKESEEDIDLLACMCYVAMHQNPAINVEEIKEQLDALARIVEIRLRADLGEERFPLRTVKTLSRCFANELGFRGNVENYYEPWNLCIDKVLERKTGIAITMCMVYMEIARRVGIDMVDVAIPGYLLCRPVKLEEGMEVLVDAFNQGDVLFIEEVEDALGRNSGLADGQRIEIDRSFLEQTKINKKAFLTRVLGALKSMYFACNDYENALQITEYMMLCNPYDSLKTPLMRTIAVLYFKNERWVDALEALHTYATMPNAQLDEEYDAYINHISRILTLEKDILVHDDDEENDQDETNSS
jgi:regulator of sirC expression with transglutaminase-like and TPR domain